ncbi:type III secretory pathway lipoprotein EscJ [Paenibacillus phyllosphaerae]|uniref:Type III secretory pathway lipoprotein EscJ n=1 Tax=Paenibacillus phyllosphaerae TaxID=274593 RepID=A0A7W5AZJ8_9BACL|nr:type III secretory pathway lipoprotein EscJ [Paenibacillus phyllosphaerae]
MRNYIKLVAVNLFVVFALTGCNETIADHLTEEKIKPIVNPESTLTRVKVNTDGVC